MASPPTMPLAYPPSAARLAISYLLLAAAAFVVLWAIFAAEQPLSGAQPAPAVMAAPLAESPAAPHPFPRILLALAAVILVGRLLAAALKRLAQPPVIGEVLAGIVLGPSLLGWVCQAWLGTEASPLLPPEVAPYLGVIAQLGIVLYMFLVGIDFHAGEFRALASTALFIATASLLVPFLVGIGLGAAAYERLAPAGIGVTSFALFFGVALAVTAFPVLARILTDRGLARTKLGVLALSCAAAGDVAAWWLLALVAGVARSETSGAMDLMEAARVLVLSLAYIAAMLLVVRPIVARGLVKADGQGLGPTAVALLFAGLLLSALATEWIGIHAVFGAFLLGVVIPHDSRTAESLKAGLEQVVLVLLLPAFFAYTGMRTEIGLVSGLENWLWCGLIVVCASLGKFGGTLAAAWLAGIDWRTGSALGILMNTRGLMELIVLNIGLDLGVITPTLFAMMVVMALVTTLATTPLLAWLKQ